MVALVGSPNNFEFSATAGVSGSSASETIPSGCNFIVAFWAGYGSGATRTSMETDSNMELITNMLAATFGIY